MRGGAAAARGKAPGRGREARPGPRPAARPRPRPRLAGQARSRQGEAGGAAAGPLPAPGGCWPTWLRGGAAAAGVGRGGAAGGGDGFVRERARRGCLADSDSPAAAAWLGRRSSPLPSPLLPARVYGPGPPPRAHTRSPGVTRHRARAALPGTMAGGGGRGACRAGGGPAQRPLVDGRGSAGRAARGAHKGPRAPRRDALCRSRSSKSQTLRQTPLPRPAIHHPMI